jgi:hypothetical protein
VETGVYWLANCELWLSREHRGVQYSVNIQLGRNIGFDSVEEPKKFFGAMAQLGQS